MRDLTPRNMEFLVIEDDVLQGPMMASILERELPRCAIHPRVTIEPEGLRAIQNLTRKRPDFVVLDLCMDLGHDTDPTALGMQILQEVLKEKVPVLVTTAIGRAGFRRKCSEKRITARIPVLSKPFLRKDLIDSVVHLIGEKRGGRDR